MTRDYWLKGSQVWTKDMVLGDGVGVELFTAEPPRTQVVSKVTATRRNLRLMTE